MDMNVLVFNYWHRPIGHVYINGLYAGGGFGSYYQQGGTGGSIACCHQITLGDIEVKWVLSGGPNDPDVGKTITKTVKLNSIKPNAKYLGLYLYDDGSVELDTAVGVPDGKPRY